MSPIWSIHRATSFHEVVEASYSDPSIIRNEDCDLPRRYSAYAPESSGDHEDIPHAHWSFGKSGVHNQTREMFTLPNWRTGLPGSPAEFQRDDLSCTTGEVPKPSDKTKLSVQELWKSRNAQCTSCQQWLAEWTKWQGLASGKKLENKTLNVFTQQWTDANDGK